MKETQTDHDARIAIVVLGWKDCGDAWKEHTGRMRQKIDFKPTSKWKDAMDAMNIVARSGHWEAIQVSSEGLPARTFLGALQNKIDPQVTIGAQGGSEVEMYANLLLKMADFIDGAIP